MVFPYFWCSSTSLNTPHYQKSLSSLWNTDIHFWHSLAPFVIYLTLAIWPFVLRPFIKSTCYIGILAFHILYMAEVIFEQFSVGSYVYEEVVQWCSYSCTLWCLCSSVKAQKTLFPLWEPFHLLPYFITQVGDCWSDVFFNGFKCFYFCVVIPRGLCCEATDLKPFLPHSPESTIISCMWSLWSLLAAHWFCTALPYIVSIFKSFYPFHLLVLQLYLWAYLFWG